MSSNQKTQRNQDINLDGLIKDFGSKVIRYDQLSAFGGPSTHFHVRTIDLRKQLGLAAALESEPFMELLYATLTAWGMHRMGPGNTRLLEFGDFCSNVAAAGQKVLALEEQSLATLQANDLDDMMDQLWAVIAALYVSPASVRIVASSKVLHHLLPDLMSPIDRQYTYQFFFGHKYLSISEPEAFREIFRGLHRVATTVDVSQYVDWTAWRKHVPKIIDNAIIAYVSDGEHKKHIGK